jgi:hypothetical protein
MKDGIPDVDGIIPPRGYILVQVPDGERFWVPPDSLKESPPNSELSGDQIRRITWVQSVLNEVYPVSLDDTLENFRRDQHPEAEITLWEHMTELFEHELGERPQADIEERKLLFRVILACSFSANVNDILGTLPQAKGLPELLRVVQSFNELHS